MSSMLDLGHNPYKFKFDMATPPYHDPFGANQTVSFFLISRAHGVGSNNFFLC